MSFPPISSSLRISIQRLFSFSLAGPFLEASQFGSLPLYHPLLHRTWLSREAYNCLVNHGKKQPFSDTILQALGHEAAVEGPCFPVVTVAD